MEAADSRRTAEYWGTAGAWQGASGRHWLDLVAVQQRLNLKVSGEPNVNWLHYTLQRYFADRLPLERCLSLGCGEGALERELARLGAFQHCDAYDIAPVSIEKARAAAAAAGYGHIQYAVADLNVSSLPPCRYDAVWAFGAVHHIERLEHIFAQVAQALKPAGLFILNEYVGPNRFQFPARQRQIIESSFELLPDHFRRLIVPASERSVSAPHRQQWRSLARRLAAKLRGGDLVAATWRHIRERRRLLSASPAVKSGPNLPSASSVQAVDPSEAIRSADIIPLLPRWFDLVERKPFGGGVLQFLLADIAGNFQDDAGGQLLEMLFAIEDALMAAGDLPSDFDYIVAAPLQTGHAADMVG